MHGNSQNLFRQFCDLVDLPAVDISELSGKSAYLFLLRNLFGYDLITRPDHTLQRPYQHSDTADILFSYTQRANTIKRAYGTKAPGPF